MPIRVNASVEDRAEELRGTIVNGYGRTPNDVMIVGEAPGANEARQGRPFVGRSGEEQARYLAQHDFNVRSAYITNVVKEFTPGNPDPTPTQIAQWGPVLHEEIIDVRPRVILAVGRFAMRWLLDLDAVDNDTMSALHGLPRKSPHYRDLIVVPVHHPASGFYDDDNRTLCAHDYAAAVRVIRDVRAGRPVPIVEDRHEGQEQYHDVSGRDIENIVGNLDEDQALGIDTEGYSHHCWSVQISPHPGRGYTLRTEREDFPRGIRAIQRHVDGRGGMQPWLAIHNGMHDLEICRQVGLELFNARLFDSMYAAYIMRTEPQGLKPLAWRWVGMRMASYWGTIGPAGVNKQLDYITRIYEREWLKPEPRVIHENDGTFRLYKPQPIERRADAILTDWYSGKMGTDDDEEKHWRKIAARWSQVDAELRRMVEQVQGPFPIGTLADLPLDKAVYYASRDPDATLRLFYALTGELQRLGLSQLMDDGMSVLPLFEEMQSAGMPGRRAKFEALAASMVERKRELQARISARYYDGRPFNPNSDDQVRTIMRRRALTGEKLTSGGKTGVRKVSTAKKSIEHLRYEDPAIADIIDWREHDKIDSAFCQPAIERLGDEEYAPIHCDIKITRVATRRISASNPNLTAIPTRHELGKRVRDCYEVPDGELFGSWDLSQIEMRYMAHVSRDPLLVRFFNDERLDVHAETAARIFGLRVYEKAETKAEMYQEVDELRHRYPAKRAGFGIITNISGPGLLDQLRMFGCKGWDEDGTTRLIAEWLKVYKGVADYLDLKRREAQQRGMVRDCWGMPRYLPGVWSVDRKTRGEAERAASSHCISGGAQGLLQRAMAWLKPFVWEMRQGGLNVRWVLQIHDEVILRFQEDLWDTINPLVKEGLVDHSMKLIVPIKCSGSKARSWGKLK